VKIAVAMNHWALALESHSSNFGDTLHVLGKAEWNDLEPLKGIDLLMASPECTRHSTACGQLKWTPEAEGSRATAWQVHRYAKALRPRWLVVENVRQIKKWDQYEVWVEAIKDLGYNVREQILNSADFGVPQNRIRWFLLGDLEQEPAEVRPTVEEHKPAYTIIDWSIPCPSIFARKKPLAANTQKRILIGLERFCSKDLLQPFLVKLRTHATAGDLREPLGTVTTGGRHHGVVIPYFVDVPFGHGTKRDENANRVKDPSEPLGSVIGSNRFAVVAPYIVEVNHQRSDSSRVKDLGRPLGAVTGSRGSALVTPFVVAYYSGGGQIHPVEKPLPTVVTKDRLGVVAPFILHQQVGGAPRSPADPMPTVMTKSSHGLVAPILEGWAPPKLPKRDTHGIVKFMKDNGIVDVGFRMLEPLELQRAMGFPDEYVVKGNKTELVKQLGNAVSPPVMRAIVRTLCT
jgi:DNA (cytosine-5)-methyltransferase 1